MAKKSVGRSSSNVKNSKKRRSNSSSNVKNNKSKKQNNYNYTSSATSNVGVLILLLVIFLYSEWYLEFFTDLVLRNFNNLKCNLLLCRLYEGEQANVHPETAAQLG